MNYKILAAHIEFVNVGKDNQVNKVTVLIESNPKGECKAYRSNHKQSAGYPVHYTSVISYDILQQVAATGIKVYEAEARKIFTSPKYIFEE